MLISLSYQFSTQENPQKIINNQSVSELRVHKTIKQLLQTWPWNWADAGDIVTVSTTCTSRRTIAITWVHWVKPQHSNIWQWINEHIFINSVNNCIKLTNLNCIITANKTALPIKNLLTQLHYFLKNNLSLSCTWIT